MTDQVTMLKKLLRSYASFGGMEAAQVLQFVRSADCFESSFMKNLGNGRFEVTPLPRSAQVSPLFGMVACDLNDDSFLDFIAVGNSHAEETLTGFYDAGIGVYALGNGDGTFRLVSPSESGFCVRSDAKAVSTITIANRPHWIITSNKGALKIYSRNEDATTEGKAGNVNPGKSRKTEYYFGNGYLSQSGR